MILLSLTAFAADVDVTVTSTMASPGDEVTLTFGISSTVEMNSIAFTNFTYDENALEFVEFEACDGLSNITQLPAHFDETNMAVVIGLKTAKYNTNLFTATFKVKDVSGDHNVGATAITKKSSTVLSNKVYPGTISVSPVVFKGTSLILDGAIGAKLYFDASSSVSDMTASLDIYNTDIQEKISIKSSGLVYDEQKGLYYTVVYISPKDTDNYQIRTTLDYLFDGKKESLSIPHITVSNYIEEFKKLAESNPASEYGKALALVESLESYTKYADNFFKDSDIMEDVVTDIEAINNISEPVNIGSLSNVELYATSLILEEKTTIRHYFKYIGDYTKHTFKFNGKTLIPKKKGELIYIDIEDVAAHDMDEVYTVTVSDKISIGYSVLNYVKQAVSSDDKKLSNLVKSLYNYYREAESYSK